MSIPMGPPPPPPPPSPSPSSEPMKPPMKLLPPPSMISKTTPINDNGNIEKKKKKKKHSDDCEKTRVPYHSPRWGGPSGYRFFLEVVEDGAIIDQLNVNKRGYYMFGRDHCNFNLEHPTTSRCHAVLQFKIDGTAYIYDLGSSHGTFINKKKVKKRVYEKLHVGDIIRFGHSTRLYIFQGPTVLIPLETDLERIRMARYRRGEIHDMQESLSHAKLDSSLTKGISWGMDEDAIEDNEDENDEITWQTYKGQLTEKQERIRGKVLKRLEKISQMKKEMDAIRAKDIVQGGLTQGQQTQIARNEQRISQILEELENFEEILNGSIRKSIGAHTGRPNHDKENGPGEEDEDYSRDEDELCDRTRKPNKPRSGHNQYVETADSLLDKHDTIIKEMQEKEKALLQEKDDISQENEVPEAGDELDAYMSALSNQLAMERKNQIRKDLSALQSELYRILFLLKIADPTGEASKNRESKVVSQSNTLESHASVREKESAALVANVSKSLSSKKRIMSETNCVQEAKIAMSLSALEQPPVDITPNLSEEQEKNDDTDNATYKTPVYIVSKPRSLGSVEAKQKRDVPETPEESKENGQFADYKKRKQILEKLDNTQVLEDHGLGNGPSGSIIRKRKQAEEYRDSIDSDQSAAERDVKAEDAVPLLLEHSRGLHASNEMAVEGQDAQSVKHPVTDKKICRAVLGPEIPSFSVQIMKPGFLLKDNLEMDRPR